MTNNSIKALAGYVLVSALTIITALIYLSAGGADKKVPVLIASVVIALALISIILAYYKLRKQAKENANLGPEYLSTYQEMEHIVGTMNLSYKEKKDLLGEMLVMMYEGEKNGRTVTDITGGNAALFIKEISSGYERKSSLFYDLLTGMQYMPFYLISVQLLKYLQKGSDFFEIKLDFSLVIFFMVASFMILPAVLSSKRKTSNPLIAAVKAIAIGLAFVLIFEMLFRFIPESSSAGILIREELKIIDTPIKLIMMILLVPLVQVIKRRI